MFLFQSFPVRHTDSKSVRLWRLIEFRSRIGGGWPPGRLARQEQRRKTWRRSVGARQKKGTFVTFYAGIFRAGGTITPSRCYQSSNAIDSGSHALNLSHFHVLPRESRRSELEACDIGGGCQVTMHRLQNKGWVWNNATEQNHAGITILNMRLSKNCLEIQDFWGDSAPVSGPNPCILIHLLFKRLCDCQNEK
jgi:hypothetical protein